MANTLYKNPLNVKQFVNKEVLSFTKSVYSIKKDKLRKYCRASFLARDTGRLLMKILEIPSHQRK